MLITLRPKTIDGSSNKNIPDQRLNLTNDNIFISQQPATQTQQQIKPQTTQLQPPQTQQTQQTQQIQQIQQIQQTQQVKQQIQPQPQIQPQTQQVKQQVQPQVKQQIQPANPQVQMGQPKMLSQMDLHAQPRMLPTLMPQQTENVFLNQDLHSDIHTDDDKRINIQQNQPQFNKVQQNEKGASLSVKNLKNTMTFQFYDEHGTVIGNISIPGIVRYLGSYYDTKNELSKYVNDDEYLKMKALIKTFLFKIKYNKETDFTDITIVEFDQSGFTGNLELLIKLNSKIYEYQNTNLSPLLNGIDPHNRDRISKNINKFIYLLLDHTLKLLAIISKDVPESRIKLREKLVKYSVWLVYRMNTFVAGELEKLSNTNNELLNTVDVSKNTKELIKTNLTHILAEIKHQNDILKSH